MSSSIYRCIYLLRRNGDLVHSTGFMAEGERGLQDATGIARHCHSDGAPFVGGVSPVPKEHEILKKTFG